jgi:hypothetical protein
MIITLYRCYWPQVYNYLKPFALEKSVVETFGYVFTLNLGRSHIETITKMLPFGAVIEVVDPEQSTRTLELDEILRSYGVNDD